MARWLSVLVAFVLTAVTERAGAKSLPLLGELILFLFWWTVARAALWLITESRSNAIHVSRRTLLSTGVIALLFFSLELATTTVPLVGSRLAIVVFVDAMIAVIPAWFASVGAQLLWLRVAKSQRRAAGSKETVGEAPEAAPWWLRLCAGALDLGMVIVAYVGISLIEGGITHLLVLPVVIWLLAIKCLTTNPPYQTPGMQACRIWLVTERGTPLSKSAAVARLLVSLVTWPALIVVAFRTDGRALQDILFGTRVVRASARQRALSDVVTLKELVHKLDHPEQRD